MKPYLTIKRTKNGIAIVAEHDDRAAANNDSYARNTNEPEPGHVYETWTREEWEKSTERKLA